MEFALAFILYWYIPGLIFGIASQLMRNWDFDRSYKKGQLVILFAVLGTIGFVGAIVLLGALMDVKRRPRWWDDTIKK